jgi:hypothetical protein
MSNIHRINPYLDVTHKHPHFFLVDAPPDTKFTNNIDIDILDSLYTNNDTTDEMFDEAIHKINLVSESIRHDVHEIIGKVIYDKLQLTRGYIIDYRKILFKYDLSLECLVGIIDSSFVQEIEYLNTKIKGKNYKFTYKKIRDESHYAKYNNPIIGVRILDPRVWIPVVEQVKPPESPKSPKLSTVHKILDLFFG